MTSKKEMKNVVERESNYGGFDFRDISLEEIRRHRKEPHFKMETSLHDRKINLKYDASYEESHPGKTEIILRDGTKHEINHHQYRGYSGCPRTLDMHVDLIYEPINEILFENGFGNLLLTIAF